MTGRVKEAAAEPAAAAVGHLQREVEGGVNEAAVGETADPAGREDEAVGVVQWLAGGGAIGAAWGLVRAQHTD